MTDLDLHDGEPAWIFGYGSLIWRTGFPFARARLAQISGVGTRPGWRRRGLNRHLTEVALDWARGKHEGVFLFSSDEAIPCSNRARRGSREGSS